ncbi:MAG: hypothetical protein RLZ98_1417 [Pseudomonadota bacterium]|jgi:membrane AbrB-like protein
MPVPHQVMIKFTRIMEEVVRRIDPRPERLRGLAIAFLLAGAAGILFTVLHLPLPWMLGPLFLSLALSSMGRPLESPDFLVFPARALVGVGIGASFTPELLSKGGGALFSILMMIPYSLFITVVGIWFLSRFARFDRATSFFSAAPGGLSDMMFFALDSGADIRKVTLVQTARVLMIVCIVPFWLQYVGGLPLGGAMPKSISIVDLPFSHFVSIFFLAGAGWWLGLKLGLKGASMMGPLILSGLLHITSFTIVKVPAEALVFVQVTIGIVIGAHFVGITMREFTTVLFWGFLFSSFLVAAAGAWALVVAPLSGLDATTVFLSYVPGGQVEMAILGLILGLDVAILATHHIIRVSIVILGAQIVMNRYPEWAVEAEKAKARAKSKPKSEPGGGGH